jgi:hypothetical protein
MIVAAIGDVRPDPAPAVPTGVETGRVSLRVVRVLAGEPVPAGQSIEVPYERMSQPLLRVRNLVNQWNAINLSTGQMLIVGCTGGGDLKLWTAVAAQQIAGPEAPEIAQLVRCYEIERGAEAADKRRQLLSDALKQGKGILFRYALDAVGPRGLVPREVGVAMVADAAASPQTGPEEKDALGEAITGAWAFDAHKGADAANSRVLATLESGLIAEKSVARAAGWLRLLSSCVQAEFSDIPADDQRARIALIRSVKDPAPEAVRGALTRQIAEGSAGDKEIATELLPLWQ